MVLTEHSQVTPSHWSFFHSREPACSRKCWLTHCSKVRFLHSVWAHKWPNVRLYWPMFFPLLVARPGAIISYPLGNKCLTSINSNRCEFIKTMLTRNNMSICEHCWMFSNDNHARFMWWARGQGWYIRLHRRWRGEVGQQFKLRRWRVEKMASTKQSIFCIFVLRHAAWP